MTVRHVELELRTGGRGMSEITDAVRRAVADSGIADGIAQVFVQHTSAALAICENADPQVRGDLEAFMARLVPDGDPIFGHVAEGPDDMPAHVRSLLAGASVQLPVHQGRCMLGTWQGIYLWEQRLAPHRRRLVVTVIGE